MTIMKKCLLLLWLPAMLALAFVSCSDDDDEGGGSGPGGGQKVEISYANLAGEWICYYQHWEEGPDYESESYYNNDDLGITFNEDHTGYLKSEGDDELLEDGRSNYFTYTLSGNIIEVDGQDVPWIIVSLRTNELQLKFKDGDYIIIAKFMKRQSLEGKVKSIDFETDYGHDVDFHAYLFYYDFKGDLNGIGYTVGGYYEDDKLTFEQLTDGERYINWYYGGDRLRLIDNKSDGRYAEVYFGTTLVARAEYDGNGYLTSVTNGNNTIRYEYSGGNMSSFSTQDLKVDYEYSTELNDGSVDFNYFIDYFSPSDGNDYGYDNYLELGLDGKKSKNLISKTVTPDEVDYYFTYSYKRDAKGRISEITRKCIDRWGDDLLNTCTMTV